MHFAPASVGPRSAIKSDSYPVREITSELDYSEIDPDKSDRKNLTGQENFFFFPPPIHARRFSYRFPGLPTRIRGWEEGGVFRHFRKLRILEAGNGGDSDRLGDSADLSASSSAYSSRYRPSSGIKYGRNLNKFKRCSRMIGKLAELESAKVARKKSARRSENTYARGIRILITPKRHRESIARASFPPRHVEALVMRCIDTDTLR